MTPLRVINRFMRYVDKLGEDECWEWRASVNNKGYGQFNVNGRPKLAHRVSYEIAHGSIPSGNHFGTMCVMHKCDNRLCVNPLHLELGDNNDNVQDMCRKDRVAHGEAHYNSKISDQEVNVIICLASIESQGAVARKFGISQSYVSELVNGKKRRRSQR